MWQSINPLGPSPAHKSGSPGFSGVPSPAPSARGLAYKELSDTCCGAVEKRSPGCTGCTEEQRQKAARFGFPALCGRCPYCVSRQRWLWASRSLCEMLASDVTWFCRVSYARNPLALAMRSWEQDRRRRQDAEQLDMVANLSPLPDRPGMSAAERLAYTQRVSPALKRLRIALAREGGVETSGEVLIRYYVVGEHGDKNGRLHHHVILCASGAAAQVLRKRHLERAFAAMRSNGSARYRQRIASAASGSVSRAIPDKDKAPMLRAAYGGHCRFQRLNASDAPSLSRVARYVAVYAAKSLRADGSAVPSYRVRASEGWGAVGAEKAVTAEAIATAQWLGYRSVKAGGMVIPLRLYKTRWLAVQAETAAREAEALRLRSAEIEERSGMAPQSFKVALALAVQETIGHDWQTGYGADRRALTGAERLAVVAFCLVTGERHLLEMPEGRRYRVFGPELLLDGAHIGAHIGEVLPVVPGSDVGDWDVPKEWGIGAWRRSVTSPMQRPDFIGPPPFKVYRRASP